MANQEVTAYKPFEGFCSPGCPCWTGQAIYTLPYRVPRAKQGRQALELRIWCRYYLLYLSLSDII